MYFVGAKIPQEMVDALKARWQVVAALKIDRRQGFPRVGVHERQRPCIYGRGVDDAPRCKSERRDTTNKSPPIKLFGTVRLDNCGDDGYSFARLAQIRGPIHIQHCAGQARRRIQRAKCHDLRHFLDRRDASQWLFGQYSGVLYVLCHSLGADPTRGDDEYVHTLGR
jgi:hypothetical protein